MKRVPGASLASRDGRLFASVYKGRDARLAYVQLISPDGEPSRRYEIENRPLADRRVSWKPGHCAAFFGPEGRVVTGLLRWSQVGTWTYFLTFWDRGTPKRERVPCAQRGAMLATSDSRVAVALTTPIRTEDGERQWFLAIRTYDWKGTPVFERQFRNGIAGGLALSRQNVVLSMRFVNDRGDRDQGTFVITDEPRVVLVTDEYFPRLYASPNGSTLIGVASREAVALGLGEGALGKRLWSISLVNRPFVLLDVGDWRTVLVTRRATYVEEEKVRRFSIQLLDRAGTTVWNASVDRLDRSESPYIVSSLSPDENHLAMAYGRHVEVYEIKEAPAEGLEGDDEADGED